jgi:hypothetical protein
VTGESSGTLEDIIVIAEKRSESLEKVPLSIVAYSSETLANSACRISRCVDAFANLHNRPRTAGLSLQWKF